MARPRSSCSLISVPGSLDAHHAGFAAGADDGVGLHHAVVLLVDPALGADIGAGEEFFEVGGEVAFFGQLGEDLLRRIERHRRLPCADGAMVERRVVGERLIGNVGDEFAVMADAQARLGLDGADDDGVESPFGKDAQHFVFAAFFGDQQHALLALGEHDLVGAHAGFALRHKVEFDIEAHAAARAHLAGGAGEAGSAHVLNADDGAGLHGFKAGFEQQLLHERVADLDVGPLLFGAFLELFRWPWWRRGCRRGRSLRLRR